MSDNHWRRGIDRCPMLLYKVHGYLTGNNLFETNRDFFRRMRKIPIATLRTA